MIPPPAPASRPAPDPTGDEVLVTDVTLREHGQNVSADQLTRFHPGARADAVKALAAAGVRRVEVLSCVHPKVAPAMARDQLEAVLVGMGPLPGVEVVTLVPNERGYRSFVALGLGPSGRGHTVGVFHSAMDAHNVANLGRPVNDTVAAIERVARAAAADGVPLSGYVSAAFGYRAADGALHAAPLDDVRDQLRRQFDLGATRVTLSDLQGLADTDTTARRWDALLATDGGRYAARLGYHPHHAVPARAVELVAAAHRTGVRCFDASLHATGGCVTGAPGNAPTDEVLRRLQALGARTGIDATSIERMQPDWLLG